MGGFSVCALSEDVCRQKLPAGLPVRTSPDIDLRIILCYATAWVDVNNPPVLMKK